jgi:4-oxalocrotonate tautomerase
MPYVEVHYLEGRTEEQVEQLAKAITDAVVKIFKVEKDSVWIEFDEMAKTHFASGGVLRSKK